MCNYRYHFKFTTMQIIRTFEIIFFFCTIRNFRRDIYIFIIIPQIQYILSIILYTPLFKCLIVISVSHNTPPLKLPNKKIIRGRKPEVRLQTTRLVTPYVPRISSPTGNRTQTYLLQRHITVLETGAIPNFAIGEYKKLKKWGYFNECEISPYIKSNQCYVQFLFLFKNHIHYYFL